MKPRSLLVAAVLLVALSGAVWWSKRHPEAAQSSTANTPANPKLADIPSAQIKSISIKKKDGSTVEVQKNKDKWTIAAPAEYRADQDAVTSMTSSLSPITADSVVEDKAADVAKYGLNAPSLTVTVHENNGKSDEIFFGDDVPAGSLVYVRMGSDPKIYAVASSTKTSLDKSVNDLRDKRLLTFDSNNLTRVELVSPKTDVEFGKSNANEWRIVKPKPYRVENFQVEELIRKLGDAKMDLSTSAEDAKKADANFASAKLVATAKVSDSSGTQTLEVRKNKDDYYARSSLVKGAYKVSSDLGKELEKSPEEFRNKKLYDFGFSDPTKIDITGSAGDKSFVRSGTDWKLNGQTMDSGSVQTLIDRLRDAAASKLVDSGFTTPVFTATVVSNDGKKTEKVEFSKSGDSYIARRENEPSLYQLDAKVVNEIVDAARSIKGENKSKK
ncbi:MAG: DUF4340 domain-containing protein [Bryobacteraceae bacterium]